MSRFITTALTLLVLATLPASSSAVVSRQTLPLAAEASGSETRVRGVDPGVQDGTGAEEPLTLELHCEICVVWLGSASGFLIYANANPLSYIDPDGLCFREHFMSPAGRRRYIAAGLQSRDVSCPWFAPESA